jgi:hypothetical protein
LHKTLAALTLAAALLSSAAQATLNCTVEVDGVNVGNCLPSNNGALVLAPVVNPLFSAITLTGSGFPALPQPDLSSVVLDVTSSSGFTGSHILTVDVFQNGLSVPGATLSSTFTLNHLIGAPFGPSTLSDFVNGTASTLGNPLSAATFPAGTTNSTVGPDVNGPLDVTADAQQYQITFTAPNQSANDTIQTLGIAAVPEPSSLALLGGALLMLGFAWRVKT